MLWPKKAKYAGIFFKNILNGTPLIITLGLNPSRIFIQHPKLPLWPSLVILVKKMKQLWV